MKLNKFYNPHKSNYLIVKTKYLTNFQLNNSLNYFKPDYQFIKNKIQKNYKNKKAKLNKKILINYIFTFLYFLNHKINIPNLELNINILPKKNNRFTILSAPIRHKLPKHTLGYSRYYFSLSFLIKTPLPYFNITRKTNFTTIIKPLLNFTKLYESNLYFAEKTLINIPVKCSHLFIFRNFIN